jgi:thiamine transporter
VAASKTLLGNASEGRDALMNDSSTLQPAVGSGGPALGLFAGLRLNADPRRWSVSIIAELGIALALAAVLGQLRLFTAPQGGSVSLEMLPLIFVAVRRGMVPAVICGAVFGLLQLRLPGAYWYHWKQVILDYPLAFAAVGLAGLIAVRGVRSLVAAICIGSLARFVFHFLSGIIFFSSYAPASWLKHWWGSPTYSVTYNLLYLVPEAAITGIALWPLLKAYDAAFPGRGRSGGGRS